MANEIELTGMDELLNQIEKLGKEGKKIEKEALKKAGDKMKVVAKQEAPKDTHNLEQNIKVSPIKKKGSTSYVWVGDVDRNAIYGWYQEFGTKYFPANPWLSRAFEMAKEDVRKTIEEEIKRGLGL